MNQNVPRNEYPNPQCERSEWKNLNGEWEFEIDKSVSGFERHLEKAEHLAGKITVPFCPESVLSGIGDTDFLNCVWYRRTITVPSLEGKHLILHFGAVDHIATVFVNGQKVTEHCGGYASFECDITPYVTEGENVLTVAAVDDCRNHLYGNGKQCHHYDSYGCYYTRVTGIWQTVWLETVPSVRILSFRLFPDPANVSLGVEVTVNGAGTFCAAAAYEGKKVGSLTLKTDVPGTLYGTLPLSEKHLWEVGQGRLYDLTLSFGEDTVKSYFGLRSVSLDGFRFLLNGKSVFQRLVLDQGYYKDGIYTAKDDETLKKDVDISMAVGFNGARLHQKAFEPRFLYHCDKAGYLVWGEYGNWGMDYSDPKVMAPFLAEWRELLARDFNHPSLIGWCPLNETWDFDGRRQYDPLLSTVYDMTKAIDRTRPCIDTSGNYHVKTDIFDLHDYDQNPEVFAATYAFDSPAGMFESYKKSHAKAAKGMVYPDGAPFFLSEYGGIKWDVNSGLGNAWGYGNAPKTPEEFLARYQGLTDVLLDCPWCNGFCYTQLYDVEQETNGLYTYVREPKFDVEFFRKVNSRKAAIED